MSNNSLLVPLSHSDSILVLGSALSTAPFSRMPYTTNHPNRGLLNSLIQQHRNNGYDITFRGKAAFRILNDTTVDDATIDVWYAVAQANTNADWEGLRDAIVPPGLYGALWASQALARIAAAWKAQKFNSSPNINLVWPYGGRDVYIKGTWTNWQPIRMVYNGSVHTYPLFYSFGVKYIYCFILDGKVCHNGLSAAEPNVYGGYNNYYYGPQLMGSPARDSALNQSSTQFYNISRIV
ncbi:hypothetical protein PROFUN_14905 [Planoprotostelium fungivorum]|uniref:AMP-activated protein kinase glycogen-binding domain-containing protein n=1 Tax=Planoprotostelium fungivorum TaxID=1890364 RepID=A0A2P6MY78_9EUKA|nr:hypothetical protein PROFUN_14905 [Planoprotostelium fungivorum]